MEGVSESESEQREWLSGIITRVRDHQVSGWVGYGGITIQRSGLMFPVTVQIWSSMRFSIRSSEMFTALACVGAETIINSLAARHTRNAAKHDWNSNSGKVHVGDANSKARTELGVCLCVIIDPSFRSLMTTVSFCISWSRIPDILILYHFYAKCFQVFGAINQDLIKGQ